MSHVREFGRLKASTMQPIKDVNRIYAGETIYHIPTYEKSRNAKLSKGRSKPWSGRLPIQLESIKPAQAGKHFRAWDGRKDGGIEETPWTL